MSRCRADRDGECNWEECPQLRDGEPVRSGRHCPLDVSAKIHTWKTKGDLTQSNCHNCDIILSPLETIHRRDVIPRDEDGNPIPNAFCDCCGTFYRIPKESLAECRSAYQEYIEATDF